jgi:hypothetical protein
LYEKILRKEKRLQYVQYIAYDIQAKSKSKSALTLLLSSFFFLGDSKIQLRFNLIFSEEIIEYSRTFALQVQMSWNKAHAPRRSEASQFGGSHKYKTKQKKQTTLLHREIPNFLGVNLFIMCK